MWSEFPDGTLEAWRAAATREIKGRPLEQLSWTTLDGIHLEPIYMHGSAPPPSIAESPRFLAIRQDFTPDEAESLNPDELQLDWLGLQLGDGAFPCPQAPPEKLLLSGSSVNLDRALRSGVKPGAVELDLWREFLAPAFLSKIPESTRVWLSTANLQAAGATPVQELGYGLASWIWQLRQLREDQASRLDWVLGLSSNLFTEIAKLRAARRLWQRVYEGFGWTLEGHLQAVQSRLTWSTLDPHTNLLRSTISAVAASSGGAASLRLEPFAEGSELARRVARNQVRVLHLEGYLGGVQDPLAGSYFLERYTEELAHNAWALMQECEAQGGLPLYRDTAVELVERSRLMAVERLAKNQDCLVGVNRYAVADEAYVRSKRTGEKRLASDFEDLREHASQSAVLWLEGRPSRARVDFAARFLALAGIVSREVSNAEEAVGSGESLVVLCAPDEQYDAAISRARELLASRPGKRLGIAGPPRFAGADFYLHVEANRLETLKRIQA